jgi:hypothetical protein
MVPSRKPSLPRKNREALSRLSLDGKLRKALAVLSAPGWEVTGGDQFPLCSQPSAFCPFSGHCDDGRADQARNHR